MPALLLRNTLLLLSALALASCARNEPPPPEPASRPVKLFVVEGGETDGVRTFPGRVDATQRAELAFRVGGQLRELNVKEGDLVKKGQVLARLDPTDYAIVLEDRQANYDNAASNFKRGKELIESGNISQLDYDRMEAQFRTASAALNAAKQDLEYTVLKAPFGGRIASRNVENFEEVVPRQTVLWLQNIDELDIIINLPESVVRQVRHRPLDDGDLRNSSTVADVLAYAQFEGVENESFVLYPKEIATKADDQTQTFKTTFTMTSPEEFNVLPGMTTTVYLDLSQVIAQSKVKWVPVRAVQASAELNPRVWVLNEENMTVSSKEVTVGRMSKGAIEILSGLSGGEEIVSVGAPYLAEGMRVTRMAKSEQAIPRDSDPS